MSSDSLFPEFSKRYNSITPLLEIKDDKLPYPLCEVYNIDDKFRQLVDPSRMVKGATVILTEKKNAWGVAVHSWEQLSQMFPGMKPGKFDWAAMTGITVIEDLGMHIICVPESVTTCRQTTSMMFTRPHHTKPWNDEWRTLTGKLVHALGVNSEVTDRDALASGVVTEWYEDKK